MMESPFLLTHWPRGAAAVVLEARRRTRWFDGAGEPSLCRPLTTVSPWMHVLWKAPNA
jgi:hypothetical protein